MKTNLNVLYLAHFSLEWEMLQTKAVEKIKTQILCSVTFFFFFSFENHVVYEIVWKNIVERGRLQMKIWRTRIACWIPKGTNTHTLRICNSYFSSTATMVARTGLSVKLYAHCLFFYSNMVVTIRTFTSKSAFSWSWSQARPYFSFKCKWNMTGKIRNNVTIRRRHVTCIAMKSNLTFMWTCIMINFLQ
jgi:hypothetical protein